MTDRSVDQLSAQLREDLRAAAGPPPPIEQLRRRSVRRSAGRVVTGLAVVVAVFAVTPRMLPDGGLTIGPVGPSADETTTATEPPSTRPSTQAPESAVDVQPFDVPSPVPVRVLAVRPSGAPHLAVIDLEHGTVTSHADGAHGLPADAIGGARLLTDGTVVVWQNGTVRAYTDGLGQLAVEYTPDELINPAGAAPSIRVVPTASEDALWVIQIGAGWGPEPVPSRADLVDLTDGEVLATTDLPPNSFPIAATVGGLLLNTYLYTDTGDGWTPEPGSHATLLLDASGTVTQLTDGEIIAGGGQHAAVLTCTDHDRRRGCDLDVVDVTTGEARPIPAPEPGTWTTATTPPIPTDTPPWNTAAPDGRLLVGLTSPSQSMLVAIDPTQATSEVLVSVDGPLPPAGWDQQGARTIVVTDRNLIVYDHARDETFTIPDIIPTDHYILGIG